MKFLSYTRQLRAYAAYAQKTGRNFILYVRSDTKLSGPLKAAEKAGLVIIETIPGM